MPRTRIFLRIHLPQAWRYALPGISNLWQTLLKDTSLVSVLGLEEIMRKADIAAQVTKQYFAFYLAAALIYLVFILLSGPGLCLARTPRGPRSGSSTLMAFFEGLSHWVVRQASLFIPGLRSRSNSW